MQIILLRFPAVYKSARVALRTIKNFSHERSFCSYNTGRGIGSCFSARPYHHGYVLKGSCIGNGSYLQNEKIILFFNKRNSKFIFFCLEFSARTLFFMLQRKAFAYIPVWIEVHRRETAACKNFGGWSRERRNTINPPHPEDPKKSSNRAGFSGPEINAKKNEQC